MKKFIILGISLLLSIQCGAKDDSKLVTAQQTIQTPKPYIAVIVKGLQTQLWQPVRIGAEQAARDLGAYITYEGPQTTDSVEEQLSLFKKALDNNPQAIIISAIDPKSVLPYLEEAERKGIPVIEFNSAVYSPIVKTTVATDSYEAGILATQKLAKSINEEGKVAILVQDPIGKTSVDRLDAFIDTIKQQYPNIEIAAVEYGKGDMEKSKALTEKIIQENPDIKGIFSATEATTSGVINAIRELGKEGQIKIVGFDSGKLLMDAIREGIVEGAITQNPVAIGYKAVEAAVRAYKGEKNPEFIDTGFAWYDKSNIDNPEIKAMLYE